MTRQGLLAFSAGGAPAHLYIKSPSSMVGGATLMLCLAGWQKVSLIDYPGKVATSVFLAGCNFRCAYCHNPDLLEINSNKQYIDEVTFFEYLNKRQGVLEGVCVSGGEPLLFSEVRAFLEKIKALGYLIKIDTNGTNPQLLANLISSNLVDYVAMDIKASWENYALVTGVKVDVNKIQASIKLIMDCGLDYEFRSTILPKFHNEAEIEKMARLVSGAKQYFLQQFNNHTTLADDLKTAFSFTDAQMKKMQEIALPFVTNCQIRGLN